MLRRRTPRFLSESKSNSVRNRIRHLEVTDIELQNKINKLEEKIKDSFLIYEAQYKGVIASGDSYCTYIIGDRYFINGDIKLTFKISEWNSIALELIEGLESIIYDVNGNTIDAFARMITNISNIGKFAFSKLH